MIKEIGFKIKRKILGRGYTDEELRSRGVKIGKNCHIYTDKIDVAHGFLIEIGDNVTISHARLLTHDGSTKKLLGYSRVGRVVIGNDVFIGAEAIILPNVKIGNRVIVGAGSVVTHDIPDNSVVVGNPAKIVKTFDDFLDENRKLMEAAPIYDVHYSEKTQEDVKQMKQDLMNGGVGFDK